VAFADIVDEDLVGMHTGSASGLLLARAASQMEEPLRMRFQATSFDALCMMIHCGLGIGLLPETVARRKRHDAGSGGGAADGSLGAPEFRIAVRRGGQLPVAAQLLAAHLQDRAA
jgi:DNA-binding transcriptional LysR family regulator